MDFVVPYNEQLPSWTNFICLNDACVWVNGLVWRHHLHWRRLFNSRFVLSKFSLIFIVIFLNITPWQSCRVQSICLKVAFYVVNTIVTPYVLICDSPFPYLDIAIDQRKVVFCLCLTWFCPYTNSRFTVGPRWIFHLK